ncbi:chemotaxis protein methyltransferase [bacterium BMS3Abin14]|nr:chemotaxis protein methyltransferase [bacterium BMS3Abin14]
MKNGNVNMGDLLSVSMSTGVFGRFSTFIQEACGIKMPQVKQTMLESRLRKRLRALNMNSFEDYMNYVFSAEGMKDEVFQMIDAVTTNKTDFFREPAHFQYLQREALPELMGLYGAGQKRPLNVWSAGCSSGKEPYSLAMVISEFAPKHPGYRFSILGTDISTRVLERARRGIYPEDRAEPIPMEMKRKYLMRNRDRRLGLVRVVPELRSRVSFRRLNLMDDNYLMRVAFDIIFFRNVIIYFNKRTQGELLVRICSHLVDGGYLFLGHAETLHSFDLPVRQVSPMVYRKTG